MTPYPAFSGPIDGELIPLPPGCDESSRPVAQFGRALYLFTQLNGLGDGAVPVTRLGWHFAGYVCGTVKGNGVGTQWSME